MKLDCTGYEIPEKTFETFTLNTASFDAVSEAMTKFSNQIEATAKELVGALNFYIVEEIKFSRKLTESHLEWSKRLAQDGFLDDPKWRKRYQKETAIVLAFWALRLSGYHRLGGKRLTNSLPAAYLAYRKATRYT